ncbi:MAG: tetratricopeptide repeat protein [Candidatus Riflebacteria bacterium]|nr:tetratricopeptide repeat protein [Candidatus Riflebacteria bacterium]
MVNSEKTVIDQGMEALKKGDLDQAEKVFRDFLLFNSQSDLADNACYNLSQVCMKRGEKEKALSWLDLIMEQYPKSDAAYFAEDERDELLKELGMNSERYVEKLFISGKQKIAEGKLDEAEAFFLEFVDKFASTDLADNAHYSLATIYKKKGMLDKTRHHIDIIMSQYPDSDAAIYAKDLLED